MTQRVAVVTGGNGGLGLEVCRSLAKQGIRVVLTARDRAKGLLAVEAFRKEELSVRFHELDVSNATSIEALADFVEKKFRRCDILVNNAGIFPDLVNHDVGDPLGVLRAPIDHVRKAMETNTYGPILLCQRLIPLMKKNGYGRIVNVSSGLGQLGDFEGEGKFLAYRVSKTALNMVTRVFAAELKGTNVLINSVCPGWCRTGLGGPYASRAPEKGAEGIVWLALLPDGGPSGKFFRDQQEIIW